MKNMRNLFLLLFIIFWGANAVYAYDLVLPKEKKSIVNSKYAFFVGKASNYEQIIINDSKIFVANNGAFAHSVKLKDGENRIIVKSNYNTQVYKIYKTPITDNIKQEVKDFTERVFAVKKDNTPLRSTPIDYGMNRISHLFKDTKLLINGEKGQFYRVVLAKNKEAWIAKDSVCEKKEFKSSPQFITMNSETFKNASIHTIEFNERLPYALEETATEILFKIYNPFVSEDSVYTINIKKPEKYSYKTRISGGCYQLKINELPYVTDSTLKDLTIVVDAGHGGSEKGAIGCLGDEEKNINLKVAKSLKEILSQMGANVIMTRECDADVSLEDRVKTAQNNGANIFISIHLNSIPDVEMNIHKNKGTSVYYYNSNSKNLAESVHDSITKILGTRKDGVRTGSFAVLRPTEYVGILVELAYMTNPIDSVLYTKEEFAEESAKAIASGLVNYIVGEE